mmetsp:Transcript_4733/g.11669  ORF Transcript_4733/g.11669 Transcript_4733/m.11669 type:complete len:225 (-) Transcript_4733:247-921(-)
MLTDRPVHNALGPARSTTSTSVVYAERGTFVFILSACACDFSQSPAAVWWNGKFVFATAANAAALLPALSSVLVRICAPVIWLCILMISKGVETKAVTGPTSAPATKGLHPPTVWFPMAWSTRFLHIPNAGNVSALSMVMLKSGDAIPLYVPTIPSVRIIWNAMRDTGTPGLTCVLFLSASSGYPIIVPTTPETQPASASDDALREPTRRGRPPGDPVLPKCED